MAKYVKISKAKNLRFRLISVLYLLFISLSIIQIPIEWLRINPYYAKYMRSITSKDEVTPELTKARDAIVAIDSTFLSFVGFDEEKNTIREPISYSATDQFFIKLNNAEKVFKTLVDLRDYYYQMDKSETKRVEFERLFEGDLKNGLADGNENIWAEWKFKHVPATVARAFLAEYKLRLNLLNGAIEFDAQKNESRSMIKLAFNVDLLQLGDTARFVVADKNMAEMSITYGGKPSNEYKWRNDTLLFIPRTTGKYEIAFKAENTEEKISIEVQPTTFIEEKGESVQFFYEGKESQLKYQNISNVGNVRCDCAGAETISYKNGEVTFTPSKAGWCNFELFGRTGNRLLFDSVYVQELPFPIILASNVSANKISKSRLLQQKSLRITATHPDMDNFNYDITDIKAKFIGFDSELKSIEGANIPLTVEQLEKVKYIQIKEVKVQTSVRNFTISEPLIIEII